jgi:DNA invertase Pin-like site-specific DNA recombinase
LEEHTHPADMRASDGACPSAVALIGYARESISGPPLDHQLRVLADAGCGTVYTDTFAGRTADRPQLAACLSALRPGDTLVVPSLARLGRSLHELVRLVAGFHDRQVGFHALADGIDTRARDGHLVLSLFSALAGLTREAKAEGAHEGRALARATGQRLGRPPSLTNDEIERARQLLLDPNATIASVARKLGTSRSTIYRVLPELTGRQP